MCLIDDGEYVEIIKDAREVKARKAHKCRECRREIAVGETYQVTVFVFYGDLTTDRCCRHCVVAREWLNQQCGGWVYGEVWQDLIEHRRDIESDMLTRLIEGMEAKWVKDGALVEVPTLEAVR